MTDFVFDSLADGQRISFNAATDRLVFQHPLVQAGFVSIRWWQEDGANGFDTSVRITDGPFAGRTAVLLDTFIEQLSVTNFSFAGGGRVLVGDDSPFSITDNLENQLVGSLSGDYIAGLGGNDVLTGLAGDDTFDFLITTTSTYGHDTVAGGTGFDLLTFDSWGDALTGVAADLALGFAVGGYGLSDVTFTSIEAVVGTHFADSLVGDDAANLLEGAAGADSLAGGVGGDSIAGGAGNDALDGGPGVDLAVHVGSRATYAINGARPNFLVSGPDGNDTLANVERLQFSDTSIAFDLAPQEAAGNTARIIGAAFDRAAILQHPDWVGIGLELFDSGQSTEQVCQLVAQIMDLGDAAFVNTVFENVVGAPPSPAERDYFVGLLQGSGGTLTQGQLLDLAANVPLNAVNIDLIGLQQTGVEFT